MMKRNALMALMIGASMMGCGGGGDAKPIAEAPPPPPVTPAPDPGLPPPVADDTPPGDSIYQNESITGVQLAAMFKAAAESEQMADSDGRPQPLFYLRQGPFVPQGGVNQPPEANYLISSGPHGVKSVNPKGPWFDSANVYHNITYTATAIVMDVKATSVEGGSPDQPWTDTVDPVDGLKTAIRIYYSESGTKVIQFTDVIKLTDSFDDIQSWISSDKSISTSITLTKFSNLVGLCAMHTLPYVDRVPCSLWGVAKADGSVNYKGAITVDIPITLGEGELYIFISPQLSEKSATVTRKFGPKIRR